MKTAFGARKLAQGARLKARVPLRLLKNFHPFRFLLDWKIPLNDFQPKVTIYQSNENFVLKTAETPYELRQVLKLRHDIFYKELQNKESDNQLDVDELDPICDHLLIIDRKTSQIVGTYRLISSLFSKRFYSEGEFQIQEILELPGNKLELGRACIHQEYRTGAIINLLWKGIAEYIRKTDTKYLFGCASVQTVDPKVAAHLLEQLRLQGLARNDFHVMPTPAYKSHLEPIEGQAASETELPALIQSYILAGAKFYGPPALDKDFGCFDFFMMLKIEEMSRLFRRRYRLDT